MDYIILHREENGEYKPLTYKDGVIAIYGDRKEAESDMRDCDVLFEISESKSESTPKYNLNDTVFMLICGYICAGTVKGFNFKVNEYNTGKTDKVYTINVKSTPRNFNEDELFASPDELCKHLLNSIIS